MSGPVSFLAVRPVYVSSTRCTNPIRCPFSPPNLHGDIINGRTHQQLALRASCGQRFTERSEISSVPLQRCLVGRRWLVLGLAAGDKKVCTKKKKQSVTPQVYMFDYVDVSLHLIMPTRSLGARMSS